MASSSRKADASESSSSSSEARRWKYDVFLSFRGADTRKGITVQIRDRLKSRGMTTFMDDHYFQKGHSIDATLMEAIKGSRFAIVVLSQNYASSTCCLEELVKICYYMKEEDRILPLFYHVEPVDVRYQLGSFQAAFTEYEAHGRYQLVKLHQWRDALKYMANIAGWISDNYWAESELVEAIVEDLCSRISPLDIDSTMQNGVEPSDPQWEYDVYVSFRGVDTRRSLVSHLQRALQDTKIVKTFTDEQLQKGLNISASLLMALEQSRFAIVVLSPNYASSAWCLQEVTALFDRKEGQDRIFPVFYDVDPSVVRHQTSSFEAAFRRHEEIRDKESVMRWRSVLTKLANLSGWDSRNYESDKQFIDDIVTFLCYKVQAHNIDLRSVQHKKLTDIESIPTEVYETSTQATEQTCNLPASSSLPPVEPAPQWKYDVFLSFRGEDSRSSILSHIYRELSDIRGVKTFKDDQKLEKGTAISPNLLMAIEESKFAVVILSPNYASSTWCLDELVHILKYMEGKNTILPIFYHVDPSRVKKQEGTFELALAKHESSGQDKQKVQQWRKALAKLANLAGWDLKNHEDEGELVEAVGKFVWRKVLEFEAESTMSVGGFEVDSIMSVGSFEAFKATREAMKQVMKALKNDDVNVIGVYGKGGVGKTTMVKHVGAQAQKYRLFDYVVRASVSQSPDLRKIQAKFSDILGLKFQDETDIQNTVNLRKRIMGGDKILVILDNVWSSIDLCSIGIPSFHELQRCNSKVLITTRESNVCRAMGCQVEINLAIPLDVGLDSYGVE